MLTEEARVIVLLDERQKLLDAANSRNRRVRVPLEVGPHPEDPPNLTRLDVSCLCHRALNDLTRRTPPARSNLEDLDALASDPKCQIELWPDVGRRPVLFDESTDNLLKPFHLELAECHAGREECGSAPNA